MHGWKLFRLFALELIPPRPPQSTLDEASSGDFFYLESFNWTLTQFHLINLHLALFSKLFCLINHLSLSTSLASRGSQTERYEGKRESDEGKYFPSADNIFVAELSRERQRGSLSLSLSALSPSKKLKRTAEIESRNSHSGEEEKSQQQVGWSWSGLKLKRRKNSSCHFNWHRFIARRACEWARLIQVFPGILCLPRRFSIEWAEKLSLRRALARSQCSLSRS